MAELLRRVSTISSVPENVLLEIFSYLLIKDLCSIGRVCRVWRRVARDNSLWRHVDLQPYKLNLQRTWKVIRAHFSDVLLSLRLKGYMDPGGANWNKSSLSNAMLRELKERCPNITILDLTTMNLTAITIENFPNQLHEIHITHSLVPNGWFKYMAMAGVFPKLRHVNLTNSSKTTDADLKDISAGTTLKVLQCNGAYRITEKGLRFVAENQKELEVLQVAESQCTDLALQYIGNGITNLCKLDVSQCQKITDDGIAIIAACLVKLKILNLSGCRGITKGCVGTLLSIKTLKHVNLERTLMTQNDASILGDRCVFDKW